jgi:hypothetical protein
MRKFIRSILLGTIIFMIFRAIFLVQSGKSMLEAITGAILIPVSLLASVVKLAFSPQNIGAFFASIWDFFVVVITKPFQMTSEMFWSWFDSLVNIGETEDKTPAKLTSPTGGETPPDREEKTSKSGWAAL